MEASTDLAPGECHKFKAGEERVDRVLLRILRHDIITCSGNYLPLVWNIEVKSFSRLWSTLGEYFESQAT
jgi:hypothetical protein